MMFAGLIALAFSLMLAAGLWSLWHDMTRPLDLPMADNVRPVPAGLQVIWEGPTAAACVARPAVAARRRPVSRSVQPLGVAA